MQQYYNDGRIIVQASSAACIVDNCMENPNYDVGSGLKDCAQVPCDAVGYTTYFGLYSKDDNCNGKNPPCECDFVGNYYSRTKWFVESLPNTFNKPFISYEFGTYLNQMDSLQGEGFQCHVFNETFRAFREKATFDSNGAYICNSNVMAVAFWNAFDFWVNGSIWQGRYGVYDMNRSTPRKVMDTLKNAYKPFFDLGGIYEGQIPPCPNRTMKKPSENSNIPKRYSLHQNYPNPFNPITSVKYDLPKDGLVVIKVYDILGREVEVLVNEFKMAGYYEATFDASRFASGVYFYKIETGSFTDRKKMVLIK